MAIGGWRITNGEPNSEWRIRRRTCRPSRIRPLFSAVGLAAIGITGSAHANNVVVDVNKALINIFVNTSASLVDGPPQVAREIALVDGAMFDAVNTAYGSPYPPIAYRGFWVFGIDPDAAALQAALTVMNNLYGPSSLYQKYKGVTGAAYYPAIPGYAAALVGPTAVQLNEVARQITMLKSQLAALHPNFFSLAVGAAAGNAMLALAADDGGDAASQQTLSPYTPPNAGKAGVYAPPANRPAMTPTWGKVLPIGISGLTLAALEATVPVDAATNAAGLASPAYALQVLQTECLGSATGLPSNAATACRNAGFAPESPAEAQAALFWNDPGGTQQPPGHWLQIVDTIADERGLDLLQTARATAAVGLALHAAGIGAWAIKYQDNSWRPITAIQFSGQWNSYFTSFDSTWQSLIALPPHPDYLAGHPAFSGAAAAALAAVLGTDNVSFSSTSTAYCNGGQATRNSRGNVTSCTRNGLVYAMPTACANGATAIDDQDPVTPALLGCKLGGVPQSVTGGGCNNAGSQPVLTAGFAANPLYTASPLICVIAESYSSLSQAAGGYLGAEFSRVSGGLHTPAAVLQALALGTAIGNHIVPGTLSSGNACNGTYNGFFRGDVNVSGGQVCVLASPCQILGDVTVRGGSLDLACKVAGKVTISNGGDFSLHGAVIGTDLHVHDLSAGRLQASVCGSVINGDVVVRDNASPVKVGSLDPACAGNTVGRNLKVERNAAAVSIEGNQVRGALRVTANTAATDVSGNKVTLGLQCDGNAHGVTAATRNVVLSGAASGQCASAAIASN